MIKKTLYFGNPAYLSLRLGQLVIKLPEVQKTDTMPKEMKQCLERSIPVEDIGVVMIDHFNITLTSSLITALMENNVSLITCNASHHPSGLLFPLEGNTLQNERYREQVEASLPLKKQLWQQTIKAKIINQTDLLRLLHPDMPLKQMERWASEVLSGDTQNHESRAAVFYWSNLFQSLPEFKRERGMEQDETPPNSLLNYGYSILRACVARALVSTGLLPTLGIHHQNKYNAFCLADDIMEPYRPFADKVVANIVGSGANYHTLTKEIKQQLLQIPAIEVEILGKKCPLLLAITHTTASLNRCFENTARKIEYPSFVE